jgi:hypothetical protein
MSIASQITNRLHVSASNREVIRNARKAIKPSSYGIEHKPSRKIFYRQCLQVHKENVELSVHFRF